MSCTAPHVSDEEAVLRTLEDSGMFDELRHQLMTQMRQSEDLQRHAEAAIVESRYLPSPTADKKTLTAAYENIRREITGKVLERMVEAVWEEMDKRDSQLSKAIEEQTHQALCTVYEERECKQGGQ